MGFYIGDFGEFGGAALDHLRSRFATASSSWEIHSAQLLVLKLTRLPIGNKTMAQSAYYRRSESELPVVKSAMWISTNARSTKPDTTVGTVGKAPKSGTDRDTDGETPIAKRSARVTSPHVGIAKKAYIASNHATPHLDSIGFPRMGKQLQPAIKRTSPNKVIALLRQGFGACDIAHRLRESRPLGQAREGRPKNCNR